MGPTEERRVLTGTIQIEWVDASAEGEAPKLGWTYSAKPSPLDPRVAEVLRGVLAQQEEKDDQDK
jgi:hypothetical protein